MLPNQQHDDAPAEHVHTHGTVSYEEPESRYRWQIHHPFENIHHRAAIEVAPWSGLLPRWRFIIPSDYEGMVRWGVGPPGATEISLEDVRRPVRHGPVQLTNGPEVEWLGGHNPLSNSLSAYIIIDGDPPPLPRIRTIRRTRRPANIPRRHLLRHPLRPAPPIDTSVPPLLQSKRGTRQAQQRRRVSPTRGG